LDASGQRHVVARREIASLTAGDLSLMPVGLVDDLNDANLAALIGFLSDSRAENH